MGLFDTAGRGLIQPRIESAPALTNLAKAMFADIQHNLDTGYGLGETDAQKIDEGIAEAQRDVQNFEILVQEAIDIERRIREDGICEADVKYIHERFGDIVDPNRKIYATESASDSLKQEYVLALEGMGRFGKWGLIALILGIVVKILQSIGSVSSTSDVQQQALKEYVDAQNELAEVIVSDEERLSKEANIVLKNRELLGTFKSLLMDKTVDIDKRVLLNSAKRADEALRDYPQLCKLITVISAFKNSLGWRPIILACKDSVDTKMVVNECITQFEKCGIFSSLLTAKGYTEFMGLRQFKSLIDEDYKAPTRAMMGLTLRNMNALLDISDRGIAYHNSRTLDEKLDRASDFYMQLGNLFESVFANVPAEGDKSSWQDSPYLRSNDHHSAGKYYTVLSEVLPQYKSTFILKPGSQSVIMNMLSKSSDKDVLTILDKLATMGGEISTANQKGSTKSVDDIINECNKLIKSIKGEQDNVTPEQIKDKLSRMGLLKSVENQFSTILNDRELIMPYDALKEITTMIRLHATLIKDIQLRINKCVAHNSFYVMWAKSK